MLLADSVVTLILVWVDSTMGSWYCTGAIRPTLYSRGTLGVVGVFGCSVLLIHHKCVCVSLQCICVLLCKLGVCCQSCAEAPNTTIQC